MSNDEDSPTDWDLAPFLEAVASNRVAPAGGSVVGLVGAAGTALVEMAAIHTLERRRNVDLEAARSTLARQRDTLQSLATADAEVVEELFGGEGAGADRTLLERATGIPLTMAEACSNALEAAVAVAEGVIESVKPDLIAGLSVLLTAARTALWIVRSNLDSIEDGERVQDLTDRVETVTADLAEDVERLERTLGVEVPR